MKSADNVAIAQFDTKNHLYLTVVGKGAAQHLEVHHRTWMGRLWMKIGISSSSMNRVIDYIQDHGEEYWQALEESSAYKLSSVTRSYSTKHKISLIAPIWHNLTIPTEPLDRHPSMATKIKQVRYKELLTTHGRFFTSLEPLTGWRPKDQIQLMYTEDNPEWVSCYNCKTESWTYLQPVGNTAPYEVIGQETLLPSHNLYEKNPAQLKILDGKSFSTTHGHDYKLSIGHPFWERGDAIEFNYKQLAPNGWLYCHNATKNSWDTCLLLK